MKITRNTRRLSVLLVIMMLANICLGPSGLSRKSFAYTERAATVNASSLNVRSGPGTSYSLVSKLYQGEAVTVIGEQNASDGALWYQIRFNGAGGAYVTGYVLNTYVKFPVAYTNDGDFEAHLSNEGFPESYKVYLRQLHAQYPNWIFRAQKTNLDWNSAVQNESVVGRNLVAGSSISSWKSIAAGAYNWDTSSWPSFDSGSWVAASEDIIRYYMDPRNFLDETNVFQFLLQSYDSSSHTAAGMATMVKGSFLEGAASGGSSGSPAGTSPSGGNSPSPSGGTSPSDGGASSGYGPGYVNSGSGGGSDSSGSSSSDGVSGSQAPSGLGTGGVKLEGPHASISRHNADVLTSSNYGPGFSSPSSPGGSPSEDPSSGNSNAPASGSSSYIDILMNAGAQSGVNPYVLAAMIIQEQGSKGAGPSISGRESGYEGYYNFFNIEAYQSGSLTAVQRGLWYASQSGSYGRPWNSVESSILGGAIYYGTNYVKVGQDTFYLKKFNVQGSNLYKHQYMTNVQGAAAEGAVYAKAYSNEMKQTALEFKIPVFNNMPDSPSPRPVVDGSPNNKLSNLSVSGFVTTPTFSKDVTEYNLIVDPSVSSIAVNASAIDSKAVVSGAGNIQLQSGNNEVKISVKAQNGAVREYILHVVRQSGGPTYSDGSGGSAQPSQDGQSTGGPGGTGGSESSGEGVGPGGNNVTITPVG